jgi:hypothetical protein
MELSKADKRVARELIEIGLQKEFETGLKSFDETLESWKGNSLDNRDAYHALYKQVREFDKHLALRYDGMKGSDYIYIVAAQVREGFVAKKELLRFSESAQQGIETILKLWQ